MWYIKFPMCVQCCYHTLFWGLGVKCAANYIVSSFSMVCSFVMSVNDVLGDHIVEAYSSIVFTLLVRSF